MTIATAVRHVHHYLYGGCLLMISAHRAFRWRLDFEMAGEVGNVGSHDPAQAS